MALLHRPRFRLSRLILLVAAVAVEIGTLPRPVVAVMVAFTMSCAVVESVVSRVTKYDWLALLVFHAPLISLVVPAAGQGGRDQAGRPRPGAAAGSP